MRINMTTSATVDHAVAGAAGQAAGAAGQAAGAAGQAAGSTMTSGYILFGGGKNKLFITLE
jgi:hypothetical protein